jgi:chemotaxis protein CheX
MLGSPVKTFDSMAASAIAELANMIAGNALMQLSETGIECDLAPPVVLKGTNVKISTWPEPSIVVPFITERGTLSITVTVERSATSKAA